MIQKELRSGYTTGSCVAAGTKAILLALLEKKIPQQVELNALSGELLHIPINKLTVTETGGIAEVIKDAGDDPDITNGVPIVTELQLVDSTLPRITFAAGSGVGTITKDGMSIPVGEPAINPGPRKMVAAVIEALLPPERSCKITVSVPDGEELAKHTLNPILGVKGGISIVGTSGIVHPMSEEGFKKSLTPQIDVALAAGYRTQIFVPGKIGENIAVGLGMPKEAIVQMSNFVGYMLEYAADHKLDGVLLFGHLGKLAKVAAGNMYTYNKISDARFETLAAYGASLGMDTAAVRQVLACVTTEEAMPIIERCGIADALYALLCERASIRAMRRVYDTLTVGTVMVTLKGKILGMDENAKKIGAKMKWNIK